MGGVARDGAGHGAVPAEVIGQISNIGMHVDHGHRAAQPRRLRAFVELAVQRLLDSPRDGLAKGLAKAEIREAQATSRRLPRR